MTVNHALLALLDNIRLRAEPLLAVSLDPLARRNRHALADHLRRIADRLEGRQFPDPRDQELVDRGKTLEWRQKVAKRTNKCEIPSTSMEVKP